MGWVSQARLIESYDELTGNVANTANVGRSSSDLFTTVRVYVSGMGVLLGGIGPESRAAGMGEATSPRRPSRPGLRSATITPVRRHRFVTGSPRTCLQERR